MLTLTRMNGITVARLSGKHMMLTTCPTPHTVTQSDVVDSLVCTGTRHWYTGWRRCGAMLLAWVTTGFSLNLPPKVAFYRTVITHHKLSVRERIRV